MMEKPKEEEEKKEAPPQTKNTNDEILDLERRLNRLGTSEKPKPVQNDLLSRIKAAQQRAKEAQLKQQQEMEEKLKEEDMLASLSKEINVEPPPPSFDVIEQQHEPPPSFDVLEETIPPPTFDEMEQHGPPPSFDTINPEIINENVIPSAPDFIQEEQEEIEEVAEQEDLDFSALYPHVSLTPEQQAQLQGVNEHYNMKELQKVIQDEQLRILKEIQTSTDTTTNTESNETSQNITEEQSTNIPQQTIQIAPDHYVPLHGPESTRSAITQGTAILTQCLNCKSYLHITSTATLMYCPCCQVVSPVNKNDAKSSNEVQEDMDRQLAQRIQDEEYANRPTRQMRSTGGWMNSLFGSSVTDYPRSANRQSQQQTQEQTQESQSWSEYFSSFLGSSTNTDTATNNEETQLYQALTGTNQNEQLPPATVADRKPVYDCILEGANSIADSATTMLTGNNEHEYHGVDTTCLLEEDYNEERSDVVIGGSKEKADDQYHLLG